MLKKSPLRLFFYASIYNLNSCAGKFIITNYLCKPAAVHAKNLKFVKIPLKLQPADY